MQICTDHWAELKQALEDRGLGHLISNDTEAAVNNLVEAIEGGEAPHEPLMSAMMMLIINALQSGGLYLMGTDENGNDYCPVCEAALNGHNDWIAAAADGQLETCRERGLVPKLQ